MSFEAIHLGRRAREKRDRLSAELGTLIRICGDAKRKLPGNEFPVFTTESGFPPTVVEHLAGLAANPLFAARRASSAAVEAVAAAVLSAGGSSASRVAPAASEPVAGPSSPPAGVAPSPAAGGIRLNPARLRALTGLSPSEFTSLSTMPESEFNRVGSIGLDAWRAERQQTFEEAAE